MLAIGLWMMLGMPGHGVFGDWETPKHAVVRVEACGAEVCLRVVKLAPDAPAKVDVNNPEAGLRGRALCGLVVGTGFREGGDGRLSGGRLYDPTSGRTYAGVIAVDGDVLRLRGYVGVPLLGRSETWQRVGAVSGGCV